MASTNPFQHADHVSEAGFDTGGDAGAESAVDDAAAGLTGRGTSRRRRARTGSSRSSKRRKQFLLDNPAAVSGLPSLEGLKPVLLFLLMPISIVFGLIVTGGNWPAAILYPMAIVMGLIVASSTLKSVELVFACLIFYLPFSKAFVIPLAPGVNGTNVLMLLGLFAALLKATDRREKWMEWPPGTLLVFAYGAVTTFSGFTVTLLPGGYSHLLYSVFLSYKAWIDMFIFYFIALTCIRDVETAKRVVVYMIIGSIMVVLYSVPEMLEKMGRATIEKSRIGGPHLQSNNFGGFVAYTLLPVVAVFVTYIHDLRAWLLTPYMLLAAKVLITTFSRGAYVAMALGGLLTAYFKGRGFLIFAVTAGLCFVLVFPSVIPQSILDRMSSITADRSATAQAQELDKSSETRLIMWRAASKMIVEDPFLGKGFKAFPLLKENYTDKLVLESDPHSMYLLLGAEMGLPALALFVLILGYSFYLGRLHSQNTEDRFIRAIGIGGAASTVCFAVVCVFGSRAVSLGFTAYFWAMLVVMQVIRQKQLQAQEAQQPKRQRSSAFAEAGDASPDADDIDSDVEQVVDPEAVIYGANDDQRHSPVSRRRGRRSPPAVSNRYAADDGGQRLQGAESGPAANGHARRRARRGATAADNHDNATAAPMISGSTQESSRSVNDSTAESPNLPASDAPAGPAAEQSPTRLGERAAKKNQRRAHRGNRGSR